jgi:hypothetical protein
MLDMRTPPSQCMPVARHRRRYLLTYFGVSPPPPGASLSDLSEADRYYLSDDYKGQVVSHMSISQLIEICLINPTVTLTPSYRCVG